MCIRDRSTGIRVCSQMADDEEVMEEEPASSLTPDLAATGLSALKDASTLGLCYTSLQMRGRKLLDLEALPAFTGLEIVDLGQNSITDVEPLGKLQAALSVKLDGNQISSLDALPAMPNLQMFDLSTNQLASLSTFGHPMLMYLTLDSNQLESLPDLAAGCPLLKRLSAKANQLTSTTGLAGLAHLEVLSLSSNAIAALDLGRMPQLKEIEAAANQITSLSGINDLDNLTKLELNQNQIATVDNLEQLSGLTELKTVVLAANPVTEVDQYRNFVHASCPGLETLDNEPYTEEDMEPPPAPPEPEPEEPTPED
eukprot:TRINITY_DN21029_c0_g1_i1.p1 TRINITY_DN21029_c0_g1~~TRINITY_DN21029_c0_g1_i1.p1  ORF type:complete len:312 (+),score=90.08 TRINITY_DN21029_c0_g1_i1:119-1054(+)